MQLGRKEILIPILSIIASVFVLLLLSWQYPATLTFPMGGDSPPYIKSAQTVMNIANDPRAVIREFTSSRYPLTVAIFTAFSNVVPTDDWPIRFIWVMTLGQITTGLALGFMLYRLAEYLPGKPRWQMASIGIIVWACAPLTLNEHFKAGTLGQLWSLSFLLLFFERLLARKPKTAALALVATLLTHPITAVVITMVMTVSVLPLWYLKHYFKNGDTKILHFLSAFVILSGAIVLIYLSFIENPIPHIHPGATFRTISDYLTSSIAPFIWLAPIGFLYLAIKSRRVNIGLFLLLTFSFLSLFLAFNDLIGFDIWTNRLHTFLILSISILSAVAIPQLLKSARFGSKAASMAIVAVLALTVLMSWETQQKIYNSYATLNHYTGLDRVERKGLDFLAATLPPESLIYTTNKQNRNAEWIPVLTDHKHKAVAPTYPLFTAEEEELETLSGSHTGHYFMFLLRRENAPHNMLNRPDLFPVIFKNSGVVIFSVNNMNDE